MIQDKITYTPSIKPVVSADAASRYLEVTKWLRFVQGRDRAKSKALLWMMAKGLPPGLIGRETGYRTLSAQRGAKHRRLSEIVDRLSEAKVFT